MTDWQPLTANDSYVIAASDGVFEKLTPQDICDILWEPLSRYTVREELNSSCSSSLADCIVNAAFVRGSMDNLAAIATNTRAAGSVETFKGRMYRKSDYLGGVDEGQIHVNSGSSLFLFAFVLYILRKKKSHQILEV